MATKKVIDKLNDGWQTVVGKGGQIEILQDDELVGAGDTPDDVTRDQQIEDALGAERLPTLSDIPDDDEDDEDWEDEDFDDDDDDESGGDSRQPVSSYHHYGQPYKNTCIVCQSEFESPRPARFCVDKPACRQRYNRQERAIKAQETAASVAIGQLIDALDDPNFGKLARELLLKLEAATLQRLDEKLPGRHPKKELTAVPVRVDPAELHHGDKVFVMAGKTIRAVKFYGTEGEDFIQCGEINANGYGGKLMLVDRSVTWLRVVDPAHDDD